MLTAEGGTAQGRAERQGKLEDGEHAKQCHRDDCCRFHEPTIARNLGSSLLVLQQEWQENGNWFRRAATLEARIVALCLPSR